MLKALNNQNERTTPKHSGERGICPFCEAELIGKCGDIYVKHWQHKSDRICDPWQESETEWHRKWKALFPPEWQEVTIINQIEKHRADIQTSSGLVIEFQNSSISKQTIREREIFYRSMIWVINTMSFKNNLHFQSVELQKIEQVVNRYNSGLDYIERKQIESNEFDQLLKIIKNHSERLNIINKMEGSFNDYFLQVDKAINYKNTAWGCTTLEMINLKNLYKNSCLNDLNAIAHLNFIIVEKEQEKSNIEQKKELEINGKKLRIVPYSFLSLENYKNAYVIKRSNLNDLFPQINQINSEGEYIGYKYTQESSYFLFEFNDILLKLNSEISVVKENKSDKEKISHFQDFKWKKQLQNLIEPFKIDIQEYISKLKQELADLNRHINNDNNEKRKSYFIDEIDSYKKKNNPLKHQQIEEIKIQYKDQYLLEWKSERKSWGDAKAPIYFDTGDGFLFKKINENCFKKLFVNEFINTMRQK
jgi:hypothetical protein